MFSSCGRFLAGTATREQGLLSSVDWAFFLFFLIAKVGEAISPRGRRYFAVLDRCISFSAQVEVSPTLLQHFLNFDLFWTVAKIFNSATLLSISTERIE